MIENKKIILLGAPGTGKGTLSQNLSKYGYYQISTGDLFRKKLLEDSDQAKQIQMLLNKGELIPDSITNELARQEIIKLTKDNKNIILDGYPRTIEQAKYLQTICNINYVIYLDVDESLLFKRITGRLSCKECGHVYNEYTNPPKVKEICDKCNIPLVRRRDDNKESFKFRMDEFHQKTEPLINFYKNQKDIKFITIDQKETDSMESITQRVASLIK